MALDLRVALTVELEAFDSLGLVVDPFLLVLPFAVEDQQLIATVELNVVC